MFTHLSPRQTWIVPVAAGALLAVAGCSDSGQASSRAATPSNGASTSASQAATVGGAAQAAGIAATKGYKVTAFAKGGPSRNNPDSLVVDGSHVFVGYQNVTAKDGSDHKNSTIVMYDTSGKELTSFTVPGHQDGMRMDPASHLLWSMSNEDGHPELTTVDPASAAKKSYTFTATAHGGGYDDIVFLGGKAYLSASNPTLKNGTNPAPAVVTATLTAGTVATRPVLLGNAKAKDLNSGAEVGVVAVDPDSMFIDPQGDLTLDNQGGAALITIHKPGPAQTIRQLTVGTQIDDTVYPATATGKVLMSDTKANTIYAISGALNPATPLVATPDDSGVNGFVGTLDITTGFITPVAIGFISPHGMAYLPSA